MLPLNKILHVDSYVELMKDMSYKEALESIRERRFFKKDLGITYRELNHWSVNGLLFEDNEEGKWRKFNAIELIWIEILKELRSYNLPLIVLKIIKETVSLPVPYFNVVQEIGIDQFEELLKRQFTKDQYDTIINSEAHQLLRKTKIINGLDDLIPQNQFEFFFLETYLLKFQYNILLNSHGRMMFYNELYRDELINSTHYKEHLEKSHLSISINELISRVFQDYTTKDLKAHWRLINENEVALLDLIQSEKQLKSINIRFNNQSKIDLLEIKEEINISINQYVKNLLVAGSYEEIKIVTQKGKIAVCEKTTKRKI